jgi:Holliday junction DNA helicase RuvA
MIGFLEGQLLVKNPGDLLVKVGGVGYQVHISLATFYALPEPPATVALLIYTRVQEDALELFGFATPEEKQIFLSLLGIHRIGARLALNILSGIQPQEFAQAVAMGDSRRLAAIPGIGKKSAERIILELKDRQLPAPSLAPVSPADALMQDALSALLNLEYPKPRAEKALEAARRQGAATLEDLLRQSLKILAK